ncbi:MAG: hypothetical protein ACLPND_25795 [Candidatus Korobacteraceae bacterium]
MKSLIPALALAILISVPIFPQSTDTAAPTAADQAAKPSEHKDSTTIIGCLSGPDTNGKYTLRSMTYRTGIEVFGTDDLKTGSGDKVKLTGSWKPGDQPPVKGRETRKFKASEVEVLAEKCQPPSETTPVSKQKQQQQQQKQKNAAGGTTTPQ